MLIHTFLAASLLMSLPVVAKQPSALPNLVFESEAEGETYRAVVRTTMSDGTVRR